MNADVVVPLESRALRGTMRALRTGNALIAVEDAYGSACAAAAEVFRAASSPRGRVIVRVANAANVYETIVRRRRFSVNVLGAQAAPGDYLDHALLAAGAHAPRLRRAAAFLDCQLEWVEYFGAGAVFVGRVTGAALGADAVDAQPLIAELPSPPFSIAGTTTNARRLRVATTPNDSGAQVYYARDRGFFEQAGVDVDIVQMSGGGMIGLGVSSGAVDLASSGVTSVASAYERGLDFVLVAPGSLWNGRTISSALIVAGDSLAVHASDLNGKTIAVNGLLSVMELSIRAWMARNGGDPASVNFVELPYSAMVDAVGTHHVDAAFVAQPFLARAVNARTRVFSAPYAAIGPRFMINAWYATRTFVRENGDVLRRFDDAMRRAARWANSNHRLSRVILEREMKTSTPAKMTRVAYATALDPRLVQPLIDASAQFENLRAGFPASEIIA